MGRVKSGAAQRVRDTNADLYTGTFTSTQVGAVALVGPPGVIVSQVMIQNDNGNAVGEDVLVGEQNQQVWLLQPGDNVSIPVDRIDTLWVYYTGAGITVNWLAVG